MKHLIILGFILACQVFGQVIDEADAGRLKALYDAVQRQDVKEVRLLLKAGVDPNARIDAWRSPFHKAIESGAKEVVIAFIESGANLKGPFPSNASPLSVAIGTYRLSPGKETLVDFLIEQGADVRTDPHVLADAARQDIKLVHFFLDRGAPISTEALAASVSESKMDVFDLLLQKGADPKGVLRNGDTLFHRACPWGMYYSFSDPQSIALTAMLDRLLTLDIQMEGVNDDGQTPLHVAAERGNLIAAAWLMNQRCNLDAADVHGETALMIAVRQVMYGPEMGGRLIAGGASVNAKDRKNRTALDHAFEAQHWEAMEKLVASGASMGVEVDFLRRLVKATGNTSIPPVSLRNMVTQVLPKLEDPSAFEVEGKALLTWAILMDDLELLKLFLASGCVVEATDSFGRTPLLWAGMVGAEALYAHLLKLGANASVRDKNGRTAAQWLELAKTRFSDTSRSFGLSDGSPFPAYAEPKDDLFHAVSSGRVEDVRRIALAHPESLNQQRAGLSSAHLAAALGHLEILQFLCAQNSFLTTFLTGDNQSNLDMAVSAGKAEVVSWWLKNTKNEGLNTAVIKATENKNSQMIALFLDAGWKPDEERLRLCVEIAVRANDLALLKRLIPMGIAEPLHASRYPHRSESLLTMAVHNSSPEMMSLLLSVLAQQAPKLDWTSDVWGASINAFLFPGPDAGNSVVREILIRESKIDVNAPMDEGMTLLHKAAASGDLPLVEILIKNGAKPELLSEKGKSAADLAREGGHTKIAELLDAKHLK